MDVPRRQLGHMAGNVALEALVGLVPFLGDVFDFAFKANVRNARIAQAAIQKRHFPELEEELPLWRQPRALIIISLATLVFVFGLGYAMGRC